MKMKLYKKIILVMCFPLLFSACDSSLDPSKDGTLEEKDIWNNTTRAFGYLNNIYNNIPTGYNRISAAMLSSGSDESVHSAMTSSIYAFNDGRWSPYFTLDTQWDTNYDGIRKTNMFLTRIMNVPIPETPTTIGTQEELIRTRDRMIGEAHFLRALFYFELVKRYGGVSITLAPLTPEEARALTRNTMDECIDQIVKDCDAAFEKLPEEYLGKIAGFDVKSELGRPTTGAALALKAKALLFYASPLHNPSNDLSRWKNAADAAKRVMDMGVYQLIDFAEGESLGNIYFNAGGSFGMYNKDIIFSTKYNNSIEFERYNTPPSYGGYGYTNPTQNLADAFGMANGKKIDESGSGYDPQNPYNDRDPRFYMTFSYNGMNLSVNDQTKVLETYEGGTDAQGRYVTATRTGYYLNKLMSRSAVWDGRTNNINRTWVIMRYAEVLLNYAEAMNEYSPSPEESVYIAIEDIRKRAGLDPYSIPRGKTQAEMRSIIRNERQVELAFEEHRFYDVRRWRLFDDSAERDKLLTIRGIDIRRTGGESYTYQEEVVEQRTFTDKMYLYPIPESEMLKAPGLVQNPGW